MERTRRFLVIDDNADGRSLLARTLTRKFPRADVRECGEGAGALARSREEEFDAIVLHRTVDATGVELIEALRQVRPTVPIIMVSTIDREREAMAAGATRFMLYDEWLCVGSLVAELITGASGSTMTASPA